MTNEDLIRKLHQLERELAARDRKVSCLVDELRGARVLYEYASSLTMVGGLSTKVQMIADKVVEFFCADVSCIALFDEVPEGSLTVRSCAGMQIEKLLEMRFLAARCSPISGPEGCFFPIPAAGEALDPVVERVVNATEIVSGMVMPLDIESTRLGFVYVFSRTNVFTQSHLLCLGQMAKLAGCEIQRLQTERSLKESEERFRFMAETTGDVIYRLKYESMKYDYLSPGITKLTGYSLDEIQYLGFAKLVKRIDTPAGKNISAASILADRLQGKTGEFRADYMLQTKSGEQKWVRDHSFPWYDESEQVIGSVGILSDVTDYKRAEERIEQRTDDLIESEEKYRTLVENVPLVVYRMRPEAEVFFLNQFVDHVFGFSANEILRNPEIWIERLYEEDRERIMQLRKESCSEGKEFLAEYRLVHKSGHLIYVLDHAIPFRSTGGIISSLDGIIMDMTGRIRLQEQLVRAEGLKTISEVSQRLAHEIRNPLMSAGGFARLLLSSMEDQDPNREKVKIIVQEVGRLEAILRTIINYLQPLEIKRVPTDFNSLIESTVGKTAKTVAKKKIKVILDLARQLPVVSVDPALLGQAVEALIRNVVYQMQEDGTIVIRTAPAGDLVELTLCYRAAQLSGDDLEHFFYPFTTFHLNYSDTDLPMSKIIVTKHGGKIDVGFSGTGEVVITLSLPVS